ncbi:hypothetical protein Tco_1095752 [Tanacetum coccineum]
MEDRVMSNNSQRKKQEVEDHRRNFKFSNNKTFVTACNDSLNAKTSNVNFVCVTYGKCVLNDNHDLCVLNYINGVSSRTRQPIAVPINTREPKHNVNQFVAPSSKKTVATDSTVKKSRHTTRKLYEQVSKTCSWWYPKYTPPGYNWKPKSQMGNVNPNLIEIILFIVDSECSKHMTGNLKLLTNFVEKYLGMVKFGNDQIAPILGYRDLVQGTSTIKRVYYVKGLNHNLSNGFITTNRPVAIALPQDVLSTSDRHLIELKNQVQHLMEAHLALIQPTQVNKVTTSCKICNGPHDTQYCMEDPEQAFVEYASSHTHETGRRSFTMNQRPRSFNDAISACLRTQLKQQQDDMISIINLLWKTVSKKLDDAPICNTAGGPTAQINFTSTNYHTTEELQSKGIKSPSKLVSPKYLSQSSLIEQNINPSSSKLVHFVNSIVILNKEGEAKEESSMEAYKAEFTDHEMSEETEEVESEEEVDEETKDEAEEEEKEGNLLTFFPL